MMLTTLKMICRCPLLTSNRESVLKKRLMDTPAANAQSLDFEQLLELAVSVGIAAIEGRAPQRIIYPAAGHTGDASAVRKFECAGQFEALLLECLRVHCCSFA